MLDQNERCRPTCIVVGSGRSGTSTVGKILHNELGIYMGRFLKSGDDLNPEGYYEDLVSHALIRTMVAGDNTTFSVQNYLYIMNTLNEGHLNWGFKDPWVLYLRKELLAELKPRLCVIATRDLNGTLNSWIKLWQRNNKTPMQPPKEVIDHYTQLTLDRQNLASQLSDVWPNFVTIDFTKRVSEDEIKTAIRYGLTSSSYLK